MFIKRYSTLFIRRRSCRHYLLQIIFIILCFALFFHIKYDSNNSSFKTIFINTTPSYTTILLNKTNLNCSGDPLKQWCENEISLCNSSVVVYNKLFVITYSVILQRKFAKGQQIGGEDIQTVLNQAESNEYFNFEKGFIQLPCDISVLNGKISDGDLSKIFSSSISYETRPNIEVIKETTIAVNRHDYVNIYHTITDLYTVYLLCRFFGHDPKLVRILFLDAHPKGNLDIFWSQLFHSYTRLGHLESVSSIFYNELIWSQSQSMSEIDVQKHRKIAPSFFFDFRQHILEQFNINYKTNDKLNCQLLNVLFLVRHNYVAHPRNPTGQVKRQLSNQKQILNDLKIKFSNYSNVNFSSNHFEELSIEEQLNIITHTDIFIGVHGAGLTHVLFLNTNRVLIELATSIWQNQDHFESLASMNNINYRRCLIVDESPTITQTIFYCIKDKISQICPSTFKSVNTN